MRTGPGYIVEPALIRIRVMDVVCIADTESCIATELVVVVGYCFRIQPIQHFVGQQQCIVIAKGTSAETVRNADRLSLSIYNIGDVRCIGRAVIDVGQDACRIVVVERGFSTGPCTGSEAASFIGIRHPFKLIVQLVGQQTSGQIVLPVGVVPCIVALGTHFHHLAVFVEDIGYGIGGCTSLVGDLTAQIIVHVHGLVGWINGAPAPSCLGIINKLGTVAGRILDPIYLALVVEVRHGWADARIDGGDTAAKGVIIIGVFDASPGGGADHQPGPGQGYSVDIRIRVIDDRAHFLFGAVDFGAGDRCIAMDVDADGFLRDIAGKSGQALFVHMVGHCRGIVVKRIGDGF